VATTQRPGATDGPALTAVPGAKPKAPLFKHPWRIAIVVGALIVVVNLGIWGLHSSDTSRGGRTFPVAIDDVTPEPGELIRPQDTVTADLRNDLTGVLILAGPGVNERIPEDQLERVEPLGQISFRPGPGHDIRQFNPGTWSATVLFWPQGKPEPTHPNAYGWSFRVGA
jgi:hypothetical protein